MQIGNLIFTEENYRSVHERLIKEFTPAGACGIEANMLPESLLRSDNLQNSTENKLKVTDSEYVRMVDAGTYSMEQFSRDGGGFGLCQWTYWSRKQELWQLAKSRGVSIADTDMQIDFMLIEVKRKKALYSLLTTSNDCSECAIRFMLDYEKPGNQTEDNQQKRAGYAREFYQLYLNEIPKESEKMNIDHNTVYAYSKKNDGTKYIAKNFQVKEFACEDGSDTIFISPSLVELLQKIRDHFGKAVNLNSGFRTQAHNNKIPNAGKYSQHLYGKAADIRITGVKPKDIAAYVETLIPNTGGIGIYKDFVHVDVRKDKSRWNG